MVKKYKSKRLQKDNLRLQNYKRTIEETSGECSTTTQAPVTPVEGITASAKKLKLSNAQLRNRSTSIDGIVIGGEGNHFWAPVDHNDDHEDFSSNDMSFNNVNIIISIEVILNLVNRLCCPSCRRVGKISQKVTQRRGLLYHITFACTCSFETSITNSKELVHSSTARMDELNMMACTAANVVGIKRTGMTTILGMLNILPPVQIESWKKYNKIYSDALSIVKDKSLERAAEEALQQSSEPADVQGITEIKVSLDGTWLTRRGHSSLHGIATVCSTSDPPKVLDFECLSRHCSICSGLLAMKEHSPEAYQRLLAEHVERGCEANHSGSSAGMEAAGMVKIFRRSEAKHLLRYTTFIGDGDVNNEQALLDAKPYGDDVYIRRLQCINHFSKRMRTALETLKKTHKGIKLDDGQQLGGRNGRLTDAKIHQLAVYYCSAIRLHINDLESMKAACWATFHHYNTTCHNPNRNYCDLRKKNHNLPPAVMDAIRPVYEKMCSEEVLSKVVDGGTTNANESYHSYIWSLCPKTQFHSGQYVRDAASLAAILYNDGYQLSIVQLLEQCGIHSKIPGCYRMLSLMDHQRVKEQSVKTAATRQQQRQRRLLAEQRLNSVEQYVYARGAFD